jgi:3-oxoacyl-[acyl-carrier protein] reductase
MLRFDNQVVLISGGSKGIGRTIAEYFAAEGARVVVSYAHDPVAADALVAQLQARGSQAWAFRADTGSPAEVAALFAQTIAQVGPPAVVVANAGRELIQVPVTDYTEAQYDEVFDLNTKGTFFTLQQAARHVTDHGRIVLISSSTTVYPHAGFAVYGGSKAGPRFFVEVLAKELGPRGITVNSVVPGATDEAGIFADMPADSPYRQEIIAATPLGRMGTPADIAGVVAFLASREAGFVTGQHLLVNGGATI